jgi:hypothetical protein|tara:strand:- start:15693 stop:16451 length:759 start_codon:yes stop_codon:yes gene_type:complete
MEKKVTKKVLNLLKSDTEYYTGIGKQFLSNSDISILLKNPQLYGVPQPDNKTFIMGRYFHCKMLEPEKLGDYLIANVSSRNSKAYKEFCAEHLIPYAMLQPEKEMVDKWCETMLGHLDFYDLIQHPDNQYEIPNVKNIGEHEGGALWKGKADIVHKDYVIDLKTSGDITKFKNSIYNYNYDSQGYIYRELFGKPILFLVIDKSTQVMGMYELSDESYERGKVKVEQALEVYKTFFGEGRTKDIKLHYLKATI